MIKYVKKPVLIHFGNFSFSLDSRRLLDPDGAMVHLRPQSFQTLEILVKKAGETVTKDEIAAAIWPNLNVSDDSLTQCIRDIRRALKDQDRSILRTIPKFGYALFPTKMASQKILAPNDEIIGSDGPKIQLLALASQQSTPMKWEPVVELAKLRNATELSRTDSELKFDFPAPTDAVRFALELIAKVNSFAPKNGAIRIGIDTLFERLELDQAKSDSRLMALAHAHYSTDGSCANISADVQNRLAIGWEFEFEDLGDLRVAENDSVRAFRVRDYNLLGHPTTSIADDDLLPTIAVIPFSERVPSDGGNTMGELMADDIISALSRATEINVISRLSTTNLKHRATELQKIAERLKANFVLSGTFAATGHHLAYSLELSDTATQRVLWSNSDTIAIADLIQGIGFVEEISYRVRKTIAVNESRRAKRFPIQSLRNFTLLIGAINLMHRLSIRDFITAREMLEELISRHPGDPLALAWMGRWHVLRAQQGWTESLEQEAELARQYTSRALEIDPECSVSLTSEGAVLVNLAHDLDGAEMRYTAALESNPNDAYGRLLRGTLYAFQGRGDEAKSDSELALHLAPMDPHRFLYLALVAGANLAASDCERALFLAEASERLNRSHASTLRIKAVAQMRLGFEGKARETAKELLRLQPNLGIRSWLSNSPSGRFKVGREFAETLRQTGVPD